MAVNIGDQITLKAAAIYLWINSLLMSAAQLYSLQALISEVL